MVLSCLVAGIAVVLPHPVWTTFLPAADPCLDSSQSRLQDMPEEPNPNLEALRQSQEDFLLGVQGGKRPREAEVYMKTVLQVTRT